MRKAGKMTYAASENPQVTGIQAKIQGWALRSFLFGTLRYFPF